MARLFGHAIAVLFRPAKRWLFAAGQEDIIRRKGLVSDGEDVDLMGLEDRAREGGLIATEALLPPSS